MQSQPDLQPGLVLGNGTREWCCLPGELGLCSQSCTSPQADPSTGSVCIILHTWVKRTHELQQHVRAPAALPGMALPACPVPVQLYLPKPRAHAGLAKQPVTSSCCHHLPSPLQHKGPAAAAFAPCSLLRFAFPNTCFVQYFID